MVKFLFLLTLSYSFFRAMRGNYRTISSVKTLLKLRQKVNRNTEKKQTKKKFIILIPVLREQEIIEKTFERFSTLTGEYQVIFITTQKEDFEYKVHHKRLLDTKDQILSADSLEEFQGLLNGLFPLSQSRELYCKVQKIKNKNIVWNSIITAYEEKPHTRDLLQDLIEKSSSEISRKVSVVDYPYKEGVMAHQLNYACNEILKREQLENVYIAIYNADSVVSENWLNSVMRYLTTFPDAKVIQQSSLFTLNYNGFEEMLSGDILRGVALLQTRWTLTHELPRIIKQFLSKVGSFWEGAHVVGHGLIIRLDTLEKVGFFPTVFINEDLPLGYLLRLQGEKIYPFHLLENSESPTTVKSMFKQYRTWFYGVGGYPAYMKYAWGKPEYKKIQIIVWGMKYVVRSILWLFSSISWVFLFIYPIFVKNWYLLGLSLIAFFIYAPLNFLIIKSILNKRGSELLDAKWNHLKISASTLLMSAFVYLTHSYGPLIATKDLLMNILLKKSIYKNKTER